MRGDFVDECGRMSNQTRRLSLGRCIFSIEGAEKAGREMGRFYTYALSVLWFAHIPPVLVFARGGTPSWMPGRLS